MKEQLRSFFYSLASIVIITYYGVEVCPFLEGLEASKLFTILLMSTLASHGVQYLAVRFYFKKRALDAWWSLGLTVTTRMMIGVFSGSWNAIVYGFPPSSALKLIGGYFILSLIAACFKTLDSDYDLMTSSERWPHRALSNNLSLTKKFVIFTSITCVCTCLILFLLLYRDFAYIGKLAAAYEQDPTLSNLSAIGSVAKEAFIEIVFVFGILLSAIIMIVSKYVRNINVIFQRIHRAYDQIDFGNFDYEIPILNHDELGRISSETNKMITSLKEKEQIRNLFGKYISPEISKMILKDKNAAALGGEEVQVVVLFSDIRGFTTFSENLPPKDVVRILNRYFSKVVESVQRNGGVLDKFIGDAVMVVFGLGRKQGQNLADLSHAAIETAVDIQEILESLNQEFSKEGFPELKSGVGIHLGKAVAGNIGSPNRMEYTVVGDTVNTASRIESLTKKTGNPILFSEEVYSSLPHPDRAQAKDLQTHQLAGRNRPVHLFTFSRDRSKAA